MPNLFRKEKKLEFGDTEIFHVSVEKRDGFVANQLKGKNLHCIDYENVGRMPVEAITDNNGVILVFGNLENSCLTNNLVRFCDNMPMVEFYAFNTMVVGKNYADIFCGTMLGRIIEGKYLPKEITVYSKDNGFISMTHALRQNTSVKITLKKQFEGILFPNRTLSIPDYEPEKNGKMVQAAQPAVSKPKETTVQKSVSPQPNGVVESYNDLYEKLGNLNNQYITFKKEPRKHLNDILNAISSVEDLQRDANAKKSTHIMSEANIVNQKLSSIILNECMILSNELSSAAKKYRSTKSKVDMIALEAILHVAQKFVSASNPKAKYTVNLAVSICSAKDTLRSVVPIETEVNSMSTINDVSEAASKSIKEPAFVESVVQTETQNTKTIDNSSIELASESKVESEPVSEKNAPKYIVAVIIDYCGRYDELVSKLRLMKFDVDLFNDDTLCFKDAEVREVATILDSYGVDYTLGSTIKEATDKARNIKGYESTSLEMVYAYD